MLYLDTVVLLAAGLGTRMRNSIDYPKTMIKVKDHTIIERLFILFKEYGIKNLIINTHFKPELLEEHVLKLNQHYQFNIIFLREDELRETGGSIISALPFIKQNEFFTCNADMFMKTGNTNPLAMLSIKWQKNIKQLMLMVNKDHSFGYYGDGDFSISSTGQLSTKHQKLTYTGLSIISKNLLNNYHNKQKFSLSEVWFDNIENEDVKDIYGIEFDGRWFHIGDPETMQEINKPEFKI